MAERDAVGGWSRIQGPMSVKSIFAPRREANTLAVLISKAIYAPSEHTPKDRQTESRPFEATFHSKVTVVCSICMSHSREVLDLNLGSGTPVWSFHGLPVRDLSWHTSFRPHSENVLVSLIEGLNSIIILATGDIFSF